MNQRTCNIILCCKGGCNIGRRTNLSCLESIAAYMSKECGCSEETYTSVLMEDILREALFDYFTTSDNPSSDLRQLLKSYINKEPSLTERIYTMFQLVDVRNGNQYINGFTEEMLRAGNKFLETDSHLKNTSEGE